MSHAKLVYPSILLVYPPLHIGSLETQFFHWAKFVNQIFTLAYMNIIGLCKFRLVNLVF